MISSPLRAVLGVPLYPPTGWQPENPVHGAPRCPGLLLGVVEQSSDLLHEGLALGLLRRWVEFVQALLGGTPAT